jgi:carbon-monoxide dehydrogenase medium subunit
MPDIKNFEYFSPKNVKEAYTLLSQHPEETKVIAGGQSLLILLKQKLISPCYLIDVKGLSELDYIRYNERGGLRIGAITTHRALETSPIVRERFFMLAEMEHKLASVQIRNWGTLGGPLPR